LEENGIIEHKEKQEKSLLANTVKCLFCFSVNLKENDYCAKCGKPLNEQSLKTMEQQAQATEVLQKIIKQELEKKGVDLGELVKIIT
jgi:ABC-type metal ion transport system substrate-binding protein